MIYNKSNALYLNNVKLDDNPYTFNETSLENVPALNESDFNYIIEYNENMDTLCGELLLEAPNFRSFFETIKRFIVTAFRKFADIIKKIISVFPINFSSNSTFADKYRKEITDGFEVIRSNKERPMGVAYNHDAIEKYGNNISSNSINSELQWLGGGAKEPIYVYGYVDTFNSIRSNVIKDILDTDTDFGYDSVEEVQNHINKEIIVSKETNLIEYYFDGGKLCSILKSRTSKEIKNEFKNVKEIVDKCLKNLDEAEKRLYDLNNKTHDYDMVNGRRIFNDLSSHINFIQSLCQGITLLLARTRYDELAQARKFAIACVNAYNHKEKQGG